MEVTVKAIADLAAAPYNPREISAEELAGLKASIERFGMVEPVVWNRRTGHVVGGHQRIEALKMMGVAEAPVVEVDLEETEEKALNVSLNNPGTQGHFTPALEPLLVELEGLRPDLLDDLRLFAAREGVADLEGEVVVEEALGPAEMELRPFEHYDYVVVLARDSMTWHRLQEALGLEKVNSSSIGRKKIGLGRGIEATKLLALMGK